MVGVHQVVGLLGRGGMGEVYRARDTRLQREVALKVLPDEVAADRERLARFQREAQVLASLNHPHIAAIYELDESGPTKALVLELVEGPTLADRIVQGPMPLGEARRIAGQIALALEAAHEQGIVHRDLKPSNIKVRDDGTVKVLDFGLAKAVDPLVESAGLSKSPTITTPAMTRAGVILGTAAYMSPEMARGRGADRRGDIWAFGCVLFEMLAGKPAFDGEDTAEVLGAIVRLEPDWQALPPTVPAPMLWAMKRCLEKDPAQRMRDIADVRALVLENQVATAPGVVLQHQKRMGPAGYAGWVIAALASVTTLFIVFKPGGKGPTPQEIRLQLVTPPANDSYSLAIAHDGRSIVYQAIEGGRPLLWHRPFDVDEARPLAGTEGAESPFWSPDGRSVAFFAGGQLKRVDIASGFVRTVTSARNSRRGDWSPQGTMLFSASIGPLYSVPADGGTPTQVTRLLPGQTNHRNPQFLPDGRRFLFYTLGKEAGRGLYLGGLGETDVHRVASRDSAYGLVSSSHIVSVVDGALWARRFNLDQMTLQGEPVPIAPRVLVHPSTTGFASITSSGSAIAYRTSNGRRQLVWVDRTGRTIATPARPDEADLSFWRLSSDGGTAAVVRSVDGNINVWLLDLERGVPRRLTFNPGHDGNPVISPDGRRVVYTSDKKADVWDLFARPLDGSGEDTLILESAENKQTLDWSRDGRFVLYSTQNPETAYDIWALPIDGDRAPVPVSRSRFNESDGAFSPDGRWIALESDETGRPEIYVQPFPMGSGSKIQVSADGGTAPRWRRDGRELFYLTSEKRVMAVSLDVRGPSIQTSPPHGLFTVPNLQRAEYEPSSDGQRFLVNTVVSDPSPITVILNWKPPGS